MGINYYKAISSMDSLSIHTGFKPMIETDSLTLDYFVRKNSTWGKKLFAHLLADRTWVKRKLKYESFYAARAKGISFEINPVLNLEMGRDVGRNDAVAMYKNTRGFTANVHLGKNFSFSTSFYENQMRVQTYLMEIAQELGPRRFSGGTLKLEGTGYANFFGQGRTKPFGSSGYDFAMATGYISFKPIKCWNIQFGTDKLFIGHGYRSLLLSDNSFSYPMVKSELSFLKNRLKYYSVYASLQSLDRLPVFTTPEATFERKAMIVHYASFLLDKKIEIGLMESTIWQRMRNYNQLAFDYSLLNPIMLVNTVRYGLDSTNNTLLGAQVKFHVRKHLDAYGQLLVDGFNREPKLGCQLGAVWYEPFGMKNWAMRGEYNYVSPYTYTSRIALQNYSHYNLPLAHPWGAGFNEWILFFNWRSDDFFFENKLIYGNFKLINSGEYGKDIRSDFKPDSVNELKFSQVVYSDLKFGYVINPITNLRLHIGFTNYYRFDGRERNNSNYLYVGISTSLTNIYLDI